MRQSRHEKRSHRIRVALGLAVVALLAWSAPTTALSLSSLFGKGDANLAALRVAEPSEHATGSLKPMSETSERVVDGSEPSSRPLFQSSEPDVEFSMRHDNDLPESNISNAHSPFRRYKRGPARNWGASLGWTYDVQESGPFRAQFRRDPTNSIRLNPNFVLVLHHPCDSAVILAFLFGLLPSPCTFAFLATVLSNRSVFANRTRCRTPHTM